MRWSRFGGLAVVLLSMHASAAPIFTAPVEGDWFDGTSWSGGVAPTAADDPLIDNGATATASSVSPLYPGAGATVEVQDLAVGSRLDPARPVDASGALELTDVDLSVAGDLSVGVVDIDPPGTGVPSAVSGALSAAGGSQTSGNVSVDGATRVGVVSYGPLRSEGPDGSSATGALEVGGDLETTGFLDVGVTELVGVASGQAVVGGELRVIAFEPPGIGQGWATVQVGTSDAFGTGTSATPTSGSLSVAGDLRFVYDGTSKATNLYVGQAFGAARADGRVDIGGDVIGFGFVDVGVAQSFSEDNEAIAVGELHVAGKLDGIGGVVGGVLQGLISVGVTRAPLFSGAGPASAEGYATIGEIEARAPEVGIAEGGPATGVLEIGSGDLSSAFVGMTRSNADASGALQTGGGLQFGATVGVSEGGGSFGAPFITGDAVGSITAAGFVGSAFVGGVSSDGSARGTLEVEGVRPRSVFERGTVSVGVSFQGAGSADGRMLVRSGGIETSEIQVGVLAGSLRRPPPNGPPRPLANGTVIGVLESTGDVETTTSFFGNAVGYANARSGGHADGTLILHDGTFTGRKLIVGLNEGTGSATGRIHLDRMLVDIDDLTLGDGATIEIDVLGLLRGLEYSAIDAGVAKLDGDLAVAFLAPAQIGIYDLIVSGALDGIAGDFDSVSIAGLAADQHAFWGIETAAIGDTTVELFRLHVVPEPTSASLLALGLLALAAARCKHRPPAAAHPRRANVLALGGLTIVLSTQASAAPIFTAPVEGDWFDGASWSSGVAPTAADDPLIDNGATATASSASPLYPGAGAAVEVQSLAVGSRLDPARPVDASGALELIDVDLSVAGDLSVGVVAIDPPEVPSAVSGSLSAAGGGQTSGNVSTGGATRVGVVSYGSLGSQGPDGSSATGALEVGGDLETTGFLDVGVSELVGVASGQAVVGGDLRVNAVDNNGFDSADVGIGVGGFGTGTSATPTTGALSVAGDLRVVSLGSVLLTGLDVGVAFRNAQTNGRVEVGGDVIGFQSVDVGVAESRPGGGGEAIAVGELHVAGKLEQISSSSAPASLRVGVTGSDSFSPVGRADGYATIGEIEAQGVQVGVAVAGPATGILEIGSGDIGGAIVGQTHRDVDAHGTLITGGSVFVATVGVSEGGGTRIFDPATGGFILTPFITGDAVGSVTAAGFTQGAIVGMVNSDGSARGYLEVEGVRPRAGSSSGILVGTNSAGGGTAEGRMLVRSGGIDAHSITVGVLTGSLRPPPPSGPPRPLANGTVTGVLESTGDIQTSSFFPVENAVGYANARSGGHVDGTLILHNGTFSGRKLIVGLNEGTGSATGRLHLDRMLVDTDDLTLGDGATIEIDVLGLLRGLEYSAIDAGVAKLDGDLAVAFLAPAQLGVYDLIISGALDGIAGDFDSVSIAGLAADQHAFWGIETAAIGDTTVELFRLHVVPEPASAALLGLGLLALAAARRTR